MRYHQGFIRLFLLAARLFSAPSRSRIGRAYNLAECLATIGLSAIITDGDPRMAKQQEEARVWRFPLKKQTIFRSPQISLCHLSKSTNRGFDQSLSRGRNRNKVYSHSCRRCRRISERDPMEFKIRDMLENSHSNSANRSKFDGNTKAIQIYFGKGGALLRISIA
jgi:hypothetical protein